MALLGAAALPLDLPAMQLQHQIWAHLVQGDRLAWADAADLWLRGGAHGHWDLEEEAMDRYRKRRGDAAVEATARVALPTSTATARIQEQLHNARAQDLSRLVFGEDQPLQEPSPVFRVTVEKNTSKAWPMKSQDLAATAGHALQQRFGWQVDLLRYHLEVLPLAWCAVA